jgi:hypothetical protein
MVSPMTPSQKPASTRPIPVDMVSLIRWIERGWEDLRANPWPGLVHGAVNASWRAVADQPGPPLITPLSTP